MDFTNLILTDKEQKIFNRFVKRDSVFLSKEEFIALRNRGLVTGILGGKSDSFDIPESGSCKLSEKGKQFRAYQCRQQKANRKNNRRYWITTGIALAALIKAFLPEISAGLAYILKLLAQ